MEPTLNELAFELDRQNAAFDDARNVLDDCVDAELPMPIELFDELDELTSPVFVTHGSPLRALRA